MDSGNKLDLFSSVGITIDGLLSLLQSMSLSPQVKALQATIGLAITLTILYKGYMVWAGKSQDPVRELAWDLGKKAFILTIAMGYGQWVNLSIDAVRGIYEWAGGGSAFYSQLDGLLSAFYDQVITLLNWASNQGGLKNIGLALGSWLQAIAMIIVMSICFFAIVLELVFSIVACSVTNTFLIIVFPLAILCFMFNQTKNAFTQWCSMLMSNTFQLLFLFMFLKASQKIIQGIYAPPPQNNAEFINFLGHTFEILIMSFLIVQVVKVLKELAQKMGGVTLDTAISGAGLMQTAGAALAMAPAVMKSAAKLLTGGGGSMLKGANALTQGVGMAANLMGAKGKFGMGSLAQGGVVGMAANAMGAAGNAIANSGMGNKAKSAAKALQSRMRGE